MKHCNLLPFLACLLLCSILPAQNTAELDRQVKSVSNTPSIQHGTVAVSVYNVKQKRMVYSYNGQKSLIPASMSKIFTTAIASDYLGNNFRFKTTLSYSGNIADDGTLNGNIYIIGGGDPLLGSYRYRQTTPDSVFSTWYQAIKDNGIRRITGRICFNQSIFDNQPIHDSWQWGDIGNYYASGISGLNFHENMYFAYFNSGKKLGYPALLDHTEPRMMNIRNINEVATGPENSGDKVVIYGDPSNNQRLYRGTVPLGKVNFAVRGALANPAATCAELFASYLRQRGISVTSNVNEVTTVRDTNYSLIDYYSNTYYVIAQYINRTSNNMYAECVFKYMGYKRYGKGSFSNGSKVLFDFFKAHGLDVSGIRIVDGSGLSRMNKVTSEFTCKFLGEVSEMIIFEDFLKTMAVAGRSGTARNILTNLPQGVRMYVKSGTMTRIKGYSGYMYNAKGELFSFCVMSNEHECSSGEMTKKIESILYQIASLK